MCRYVPEDQIWTTKSGSEDSGFTVGSSEQGDTETSSGTDTFHFMGGESQEGEEEEEEEEEEVSNDLEQQFAKCREGIRLYRGASIASVSPKSHKRHESR